MFGRVGDLLLNRFLPRNGVDVRPRNKPRATLIARVHELNLVVSSAQREMLSCLAELEQHEAWLDDGAHDMPHWVSMQLGVSRWKAERWVAAGAALESLPAIAESFASAEIGIDKVVELTRFATPDDEEALLEWAGDVASGAIRRRGEELRRAERVEIEQIEEDRWLAWRWTDEGRRLLLEAELPAAQGAVVTEALDRLADEIPAMPGEESRLLIGRRRADALTVACASGRHADRDATVVIHVQAETLTDDGANARTDDGVVLPTTLRADSCATRGCRRWWRRPTDRWSAWVAPHGSRRLGWSGSSATATDRARSPDAATRGSRRRTTSDGGHAADRPTSTTLHWSARSTIAWCTSSDGTSNARPRARCDGSGPTASGIEPAPAQRRDRSRPEIGSPNPSSPQRSGRRRALLDRRGPSGSRARSGGRACPSRRRRHGWRSTPGTARLIGVR